ncbi:MAG TPA: condensation domain-containing protein [Candidatus Dormibacteraeota bacterium]|nr:condensation domain-containing protein [Candidatus Dormibacteraeota bacterium]
MTAIDNSAPSGLSAAKEELIARLLGGRGISNPAATLGATGLTYGLPQLQHDAAHRYEKFPLSETQQAYWVGRRKAGEFGTVGAHSYVEVRMDSLDVERLERAWGAVVERHDMLRAVIDSDGKQRILRQTGEYRIEREDYGSEGDCELARARLRDLMSHEVFDVARWPLFRLVVTRGPGCGAMLHLNVDGVLLDSWSLSTVISECVAWYATPELRLPPLAVTFRDYIMAGLAIRTEPRYKASLRWWRQRLATLPGPPELPVTKRPQPLSNPKLVRCGGELNADRWRRLRQKANLDGITPPCLLLTLYAEALGKWCSSRRFTVSLPRFDRPAVHPQIDLVAGKFASFTLLCCDLSAPATLRERSRAIQRETWDLLEHQDVSGLTVIRELIKLRGRESASFPVAFAPSPNFGSHKPSTRTPTEASVLHAVTQTPQVWLKFQVGEQDECLVFNWDAIDGLFPPGVLEEANTLFTQLLESLAADDARWDLPAF